MSVYYCITIRPEFGDYEVGEIIAGTKPKDGYSDGVFCCYYPNAVTAELVYEVLSYGRITSMMDREYTLEDMQGLLQELAKLYRRMQRAKNDCDKRIRMACERYGVRKVRGDET